MGPALECCRNQGAAYLFESLNIKVHPVDVDAQGMDTARLSGIEAQLVHVMPSHQYPIGATLSPARRTSCCNGLSATASTLSKMITTANSVTKDCHYQPSKR